MVRVEDHDGLINLDATIEYLALSHVQKTPE